MVRQPNKKIYLYGRLSHEDELAGDSNSIINQRKILTKYVEENGFTPYEFIYDDGYSGADFERPAFSRMIEDVEAGNVSTIGLLLRLRNIVGFKKRITMQFKDLNSQMDSLIQQLTPQIIAELKSLCDAEPKGMLNVSANFQERTREGSELDQYIGVATSKMVSNDYDILYVAASIWAIFKVVGAFPDAIQDTWLKYTLNGFQHQDTN